MISFPVRFRVRQVAADGAIVGPPQILLCEEAGTFVVGKSEAADVPLPGDAVSRRHLSLVLSDQAVGLRDEGSTNGTFVNGARVLETTLVVGDQISIPGWVLELLGPPESAETATQIGADTVDPSLVSRLIAPQDPAAPPTRRVFPDADFGAREAVTLEALRASGHPVEEVRFCAVGGGLGSFVWVDHLRCYGVEARDIRVIGSNDTCYQSYKRYCKNSQIPDDERIRSNAQSRPDNIWGFPGYALREAGQSGSVKGLFQVLGEPALAQSYTPRAGDVYDSLDREAARIGWPQMRIKAQVLGLRKTTDGRYAVAYKLWGGEAMGQARNRYLVADVVHLATGYSATRFVDDFQAFITNHPQSRARVANAYEPHDQIYLEAERRGAPVQVVVRGRGIVASRVLQRLAEARAKNPHLRILHAMRAPLGARDGARFNTARRRVRHNVEIQPFNWPKSCWGGPLRAEYEAADVARRGAMLAQLGGTTTAARADWTALIARGTQEGWYRPIFGPFDRLDPLPAQGQTPAGVRVQLTSAEGQVEHLDVDYLIDCTGLISDITRAPLLADMVETYRLPRNHAFDDGTRGEALGLACSDDFEIEGLRNGTGRVYGAGTITTGGPYLAVDSFLGLQYAALRAVDHMVKARHYGLRPLGGLRSLVGWSKWMIGANP